LVAFDAGGLPLGVVWQKSWSRTTIATKLSAKAKNRRRKMTPIEEKESLRWIEGLRAARDVAEACPQTTCVCVADSEADIYEVFSEPLATRHGQVELLVRAGQNRATKDPELHWLEAARATSCLFRCSVNVSSRTAKIAGDTRKRRESRDARIAEVEARATTVTLRPPSRPDRKLPDITVNVVLVEETNPPNGVTPIQWLLVTTLPIDTVEDAQQIVSYYTVRWQIEVYFKTLKSGCRIENRQFETLPRILNCLAVYSIVAWKIMYLCRLGRDCPDLDCEVVFEPSEWKSVYVMVRKEEAPSTPPRLNEIVRMIASLGGYVNRRSTEPGPQTLWLGLQRVHDLSTAWQTFGPD
jgi:hypothetical protein